MKLSEAIEKALTSGMYKDNLCFMCWALEAMGQSEHIPAVMDLVHSFNHECRSLSGALSCYESTNHIKDLDLHTTELYVWWVFDLKRKGL